MLLVPTTKCPAGMSVLHVVVACLACACTTSASTVSMRPTGRLLYLDYAPGDVLTLAQLNLADNSTSNLLGLGPGESFFDMVSATSKDGSMYYATVMVRWSLLGTALSTLHSALLSPMAYGASSDTSTIPHYTTASPQTQL